MLVVVYLPRITLELLFYRRLQVGRAVQHTRLPLPPAQRAAFLAERIDHLPFLGAAAYCVHVLFSH